MVQENPIVGDIEGNLQLAINAIDKLSKQSSPDIFLFTEMFITGYPPEDLILRDDMKLLKNSVTLNLRVLLLLAIQKKKGIQFLIVLGY